MIICFNFTRSLITVASCGLSSKNAKSTLVCEIDKLSYWYLYYCALWMQFPNNSAYSLDWCTWFECVTYYFKSEIYEMLTLSRSNSIDIQWCHWIKRFEIFQDMYEKYAMQLRFGWSCSKYESVNTFKIIIHSWID